LLLSVDGSGKIALAVTIRDQLASEAALSRGLLEMGHESRAWMLR
jgi:hypothetical protein